MPPQSQNGVINFQVFISYKSQQESWAKRLAETLRGFGLTVWRDHDAKDGIRVSEKWTDEIRNGIRSSKVMIVLWSKLISQDAGSVVHQEIEEMDDMVKNDQTGQHKFIPVKLDGTTTNNYQRLSSFQADVSFQELYQKYGDSGASKASSIEWYGTIKTLAEALDIKDLVEMRYVVAAMTRSQAEQLEADPNKYANDSATLKLMCDLMQKTNVKFDVTRYGDTPDDWQPFPQLENVSIKEIVNTYDYEKRTDAFTRNDHAKWIIVSYSADVLSGDAQTRQKALNEIEEGPCLVIVDPVSLMHREVFNRIITNGSLHNQKETYFIGVSPFVALMHGDLYDKVNEIDTLLESNYLQTAYSRFKLAFIPNNRMYVMNVEHEYQFFRWLQIAADKIVLANKTPLRLRSMNANQATLQRIRRKGIGAQTVSPPSPNVFDMSGSRGGDK
jgi:hypothetical protein